MTALVHQFIGSAALATAVPGLAVGFALGLVHFATLWWNTGWFAEGRPFAAFLLQMARFALVVVVFAVAARFGAVALLAAALGFLAGRRVIVSRVRRLS